MTSMAKPKTVFICQTCEAQSPKWAGQCPNCGAWNTLVESIVEGSSSKGGRAYDGVSATVVRLSDVHQDHTTMQRFSAGIGEFDRVLGGGIVQGSVTIIGGEPGIGKSTILTQIMINILKNKDKDYRIMYVCGEESPEQIALRIKRLSPQESKILPGCRIYYLIRQQMLMCVLLLWSRKLPIS